MQWCVWEIIQGSAKSQADSLARQGQASTDVLESMTLGVAMCNTDDSSQQW